MNSFLSLLERETPEKRVVEWLKHCSAAPKDVEYCRVDSGGPENESNECELTANVHLRNKSCVLNVQHSTKRQNESFSTNQNNHSKDKHRKSSESDSGCLTSSTALRLYSREESQHIIRYIVENDAFPFLKGTLLWQKMENEKVCYRSWQSMKQQFIKKIYPNLGEYPVKNDDIEKFMEYMKPSPPRKIIHMEPGQRGWRKNGKYYTIEEDLTILKYIFQRRRHLQVHGNSLWQTMEDRQILPGRTWQSMRSRYLNAIRHSLDEYKSKGTDITFLNLNEKGSRLKKKSKVNVDSPLSSCTNTQKLVSRKAATQDIRKYAISTGTQLASKLKVFGKIPEHLRDPNKEIQQTSCSLEHRKASDGETPALEQLRLRPTSERNEKNDKNRKEVECSISCNVSSVVPDLQKDDALTNKSVDKSENANKKSDKSDTSVENSRSCLNSDDCSSISPVSKKITVKDTRTFVKNRSSKNCENVNRNNVERAIPDHVSNLQESVSESENFEMTSCQANHTRSEEQVIDNETQSEISVGSFSSRTTLKYNSPNRVHTAIKNCVQCSSDHKLSPSSN